MIEAILDRAGRYICSGRTRPAHGCKLVKFVDIINLDTFVAIESVLKMVASITIFESGDYTGIPFVGLFVVVLVKRS